MRGQEVTRKQTLSRWECWETWCAEKEQKGIDNSKMVEFEQESCWKFILDDEVAQETDSSAASPLTILHMHFWARTKGGCWSLTCYKGRLSISSSGLWGKREKKKKSHDMPWRDRWMGCKLPCALQQHPLPTLCASCLGQAEERYIRARPQRHFAFPLLLFACCFCMTLVMKLKTLVQLQAAILGSIASSPDTEITIFQASN